MPLQGACLRVLFALWMLVPLQCAAAVCRCSVPLQGAAVRMLFALGSLVARAAALLVPARCHCTVPLQDAAFRMPLSKCCAHF